MVNILDVLETIKTSSSTPGKTDEASKAQTETKLTEAEAAKSQAETKTGPSECQGEILGNQRKGKGKRSCRTNSA
jgi:hypothetical protein